MMERGENQQQAVFGTEYKSVVPAPSSSSSSGGTYLSMPVELSVVVSDFLALVMLPQCTNLQRIELSLSCCSQHKQLSIMFLEVPF
jgi:hypothetical protein